MKVLLKDLNDGFSSLTRISNQPLIKNDKSTSDERAKYVYKMSRVFRSAKSEIEVMNDTQQRLMKSHGINVNGKPDAENVEAYNEEMRRVLNNEHAELWGDPFQISEIEKMIGLENLLPADLGNLIGWLIIEEEERKAATAAV